MKLSAQDEAQGTPMHPRLASPPMVSPLLPCARESRRARLQVPQPTFLCRVHDGSEALGPIPLAIVASDLDLKGCVGMDAVVAVDEVLGISTGHPGRLPTGAALPAEGQQVAEAVSILVLP